MRRTRSTRQRQAILEAMYCGLDHPTAEEVFFAVRERLPSISLGTVYRNLRLLAAQGVLAEIDTTEGVRRYDFNTEPHAHVVCTRCGRIADVQLSDALIGQMEASAERESGYRIAGRRVEFNGLCPQCQSGRDAHGRAPADQSIT